MKTARAANRRLTTSACFSVGRRILATDAASTSGPLSSSDLDALLARDYRITLPTRWPIDTGWRSVSLRSWCWPVGARRKGGWSALIRCKLVCDGSNSGSGLCRGGQATRIAICQPCAAKRRSWLSVKRNAATTAVKSTAGQRLGVTCAIPSTPRSARPPHMQLAILQRFSGWSAVRRWPACDRQTSTCRASARKSTLIRGRYDRSWLGTSPPGRT